MFANELKIEWVPIGSVTRYDRNPRKNDHAVDAVKASIAEFGWRSPIVVDLNRVIVCGDTRYLAAQQLNLEQIPIHVAENLSAEQIKAFRIADNKVGELAQWDLDRLVPELLELNSADFDMTALGFSADELNNFFDAEQLDSEEEEPFTAESAPAEPISVPGRIYRLGSHRLLCGDALSVHDIRALLAGESPDLVFTDPPYDLEDGSYLDTLLDVCKHHVFIMNSEQRIVELAARHRTAFRRLFANNFKVAGILSNNNPITMVDYIAEFRKEESPCHFQNHHDCFSTYLAIAKIHGTHNAANFGHSQAKRPELPKKFILHYSKRGELVLDIFGGVGSTLLACEQTGRRCCMLEISPANCDIIRRRYAEHVHGAGVDWIKETEEI